MGLITINMVCEFLRDFARFMWNFMMIILLMTSMAIVVTGTLFVFRVTFQLWWEQDPFKFYLQLKEGVKNNVSHLVSLFKPSKKKGTI